MTLGNLWRNTKQEMRDNVWPLMREWPNLARCFGLVVLAAGLIGVWTDYKNIHPDDFQFLTFLADFGSRISAELVGIAITALVIDTLNGITARRERKRAVIQQIGSQSNDFALEAVRIARSEGWLFNGSLKGETFSQADLHGAVMWEDVKEEEFPVRFADLQEVDLQHADLGQAQLAYANLQKARLIHAKLQKTVLNYANLQEAWLTDTELEEASLIGANLQGAKLNSANLQGADLSNASLEGANLTKANLANANLAGANLQCTTLQYANLMGANIPENVLFNSNTILPDGTYWQRDADLDHFTSEIHSIG